MTRGVSPWIIRWYLLCSHFPFYIDFSFPMQAQPNASVVVGNLLPKISYFFFSSRIHLAVSICGVNCETSIYHSCGKLAEGPEKSHGNDEEPGKWISTMYPGEVRLRIMFILVCKPPFLAQMLKYICVDQLTHNCGLLVYEGCIEDVFYWDIGIIRMVTFNKYLCD